MTRWPHLLNGYKGFWNGVIRKTSFGSLQGYILDRSRIYWSLIQLGYVLHIFFIKTKYNSSLSKALISFLIHLTESNFLFQRSTRTEYQKNHLLLWRWTWRSREERGIWSSTRSGSRRRSSSVWYVARTTTRTTRRPRCCPAITRSVSTAFARCGASRASSAWTSRQHSEETCPWLSRSSAPLAVMDWLRQKRKCAVCLMITPFWSSWRSWRQLARPTFSIAPNIRCSRWTFSVSRVSRPCVATAQFWIIKNHKAMSSLTWTRRLRNTRLSWTGPWKTYQQRGRFWTGSATISWRPEKTWTRLNLASARRFEMPSTRFETH